MATPGARYCNLDRAQLESLEEKEEIKGLPVSSSNYNNTNNNLSGSSRAALTRPYTHYPNSGCLGTTAIIAINLLSAESPR